MPTATFQLVAQSVMQEYLPAITIDDSGTVAIWDDAASRAGRVSAPQPIANPIQLADGPSRDSGAASIGDQSMVVWLRNDDLWAQRVDAAGNSIGAPIYIAFTDSRHTQRMAIGASRDHYLVVWEIQSRILASVLDANGNILDFAIPLMTGEFGRNVERISVASNGTEFLVAWDASTSEPWVTPCALECPAADRDVHAVIVNDDGTPRSETERVIGSGGDPDVASNGRDYLIAWSRFGGGISAMTISSGFASASDPIAITTARDFGAHAGFDGTMYDVAWINADASPVLAGKRITTTGAVAEPIATGRVYSGFQSRDFDLTARDGKIVLAVPADGHLHLQVLSVTPAPPARVRAVRH
jgi:hypothetical protein